MKDKLSRIRSPWRRLLISLVINCLVAFDQVRSPRRKIHWVGSHARPRRLERAFAIVVMFVAMLTFEPHQYMAWAIAWGGGASLFVIVLTMYKLVQRITDPWINSELR